MTKEQILQEASALQEEIKSHRLWLHTHAETGFDLTETKPYVKSALTEMGYTVQECGKAGLVTTVGKPGGKVLLLRADMDALPIAEEAIGQRRQKIKARYPELQRVFDESYLDALWYLVLTPGSTERTIAAQRAALRRYLLERGNTVPPRRLWRPLLRMYFSSPRKLLKQPQNAIEQTEDYFT